MTKRIMTLLTALAFTACTTLRPVADLSPPALAESLRPGDIVEVSTAGGDPLVLTIVRVSGEGVSGKTAQGAEQTIPYASITAVGKREVNTKATTGLVAGIVAAIVALVALGGGDILEGGSGSNDDGY